MDWVCDFDDALPNLDAKTFDPSHLILHALKHMFGLHSHCICYGFSCRLYLHFDLENVPVCSDKW